jgi:hypothetical protein
MNTFTYAFDELPLVIHAGVEAALISGDAEIRYSFNGDWKIRDVRVEGFGERINGKREWPMVPAGELASIITYRLENEWSHKVSDAVAEQLMADRDEAADARYEDYRSQRMEG